jgi:4-hydroxybenzoate polyprenyltransferase
MDSTQENDKLYAFLRLIRWENLIIIFATQYLFGKYVINALLYTPDQVFQKFYLEHGQFTVPFHYGLQFSDFNLFLFCFSTVCIAAAGYIINDYFDVKTDRINRPSTMIVDKLIKRRVAMLLHVVFNLLGLGLGVYLSILCGNIQLSMIHLISATLLWFYSTNFKKMFFTGNFVVALLIGVVPITLALFNYNALVRASSSAFVNDPVYYQFILMHEIDLFRPLVFALVFGLFAFLINFMREIVKDIEDFVGDLETGGKTIPITMGHGFARKLIQIVNGVTIIFLIIVAIKFIQSNKNFVWYKLGVSDENYSNSDWISFCYLSCLIILPLIFFSLRFNKSDTPAKYKRAGMILKLVMLFGILYSFVIWYNFTQPIT